MHTHIPRVRPFRGLCARDRHDRVQSQGRSCGRKLLCVFVFEKRQIVEESLCALFHLCILRSEVCNLVWECVNTHVYSYALLNTPHSSYTHTHTLTWKHSWKPVFQLIIQHMVTQGIVFTGVDRYCRVVQQLAEWNLVCMQHEPAQCQKKTIKYHYCFFFKHYNLWFWFATWSKENIFKGQYFCSFKPECGYTELISVIFAGGDILPLSWCSVQFICVSWELNYGAHQSL